MNRRRTVLMLREAQYAEFRKQLGSSDWFFQEGRSLFVFALGSQRSAVFDALQRNPAIRVVWRGSFLPWWATPFGIIAAAYGGILQIRDVSGLETVRDNLVRMAAVEYLITDGQSDDRLFTLLQSQGRHARALALAERGERGVLGALFVDDDATDEYPVIYCFNGSLLCPFIPRTDLA
ncbi:hypothetical protein DB347_22670 [Opitutaceae bacterium EW11]|nr:hypothetical protein DB347_22670 [Opitutaceae bacterium EW11]